MSLQNKRSSPLLANEPPERSRAGTACGAEAMLFIQGVGII